MGLHVGMKHFTEWRRVGHIPVLIILQIIFIVLFAKFVIYNPDNAVHHKHSNKNGIDMLQGYAMFQDVHVMIFIGFGFLMTFLKKYGLSAVSLNMLCAVICLQWATLVIGFFHLHTEHKVFHDDGSYHIEEYPWPGVIYLDLTDSMLFSDFASATVLISFGVLIGKTSPLQLIVMSLIEIVLFTVNEVIGRQKLFAIDAGDTIFVHTFGAYFGLAASRVMYAKSVVEADNQESDYTHDLFSMIGTIFLWMFWPSFNSAATIPGDAQHRAVLNTYFALCSCVLAAFAMSAMLNEHKKFVMEHLQNATLAGGVAIGACADLMIQPFGALIVGGLAGILSVVGFELVTPFLIKKLKIHDTCGVHNLHGMPGVMGALTSCILAAVATKDMYGESLTAIYPALGNRTDEYGVFHAAISPGQQATNQLVATIVTIVIAMVGGTFTGFILKCIGSWQRLDETYRHNATVVQLALSVGNISGGGIGLKHLMPKEAFFDDNLFFEVHDDVKRESIVIVDHSGKKSRYDARRNSLTLSGISMH